MDFITYAALIGVIVSGSMLDSTSTIPLKVCALCLAWLIWRASKVPA